MRRFIYPFVVFEGSSEAHGLDQFSEGPHLFICSLCGLFNSTQLETEETHLILELYKTLTYMGIWQSESMKTNQNNTKPNVFGEKPNLFSYKTN